MHRRSRFAAFSTAAFIALVALSQGVLAQAKDAAAKKLDKDAMESDFLGATFDAAEKKLNEAIKTCGDKGCTPKLKAQIFIHLGIVQVNLNKKDDAKKAFQEGLKIDNSVAPESDYSSDDVKAVFADAKKGGGGTTTPPDKTGGAAGSEPAPPPPGDLEHEPVKEQMIETPVPIFVGIPEGMKVAKVIVMYRGFGAEEWKKLELKKLGGGYGGEIPCEETGTTGDLKYYIKAVDSGGDPLAEVGSKGKPLVCKIKNQLDGEAPHLPDKAPPAKCQGKGTCPPDFPGCKEPAKCGPGGWGASCGRDKDCQCNYHCKKEEGKDEGTCEEGSQDGENGPVVAGPFKKNWLSFTVSPDLAIISGDDVCGTTSQRDEGYSCFRSDGKQYHGNPSPNAGNAIAGGVALSTIRLMAGYDRVLGKNFTIGARLGFAFNGGPKPDGGNAFLPVHAEARVGYWIGNTPFAKPGFRPFVFLGGGLAQVDTKVDVSVRENEKCSDYSQYGGLCPVFAGGTDPVQYNPQGQTVSAWKKSGQSFAAIGGGAQYAFSARAGLTLGLKAMMMFPTSGFVISPELGFGYGF